MKAFPAIICAVILASAVLTVLPGYAHMYHGSTESGSQTVDVYYIVLTLGNNQYVDVPTIDFVCHTETVIDSTGHHFAYVPDSVQSITVDGSPVNVHKFVEFDLTITPSDDMPDYTLSITFDSGTISTDYTYYVEYINTSEGALSSDTGIIETDFTSEVLIPGEGETIDYDTMTVRIYSSIPDTTDPPADIFTDVTLTFSANVEVA